MRLLGVLMFFAGFGWAAMSYAASVVGFGLAGVVLGSAVGLAGVILGVGGDVLAALDEVVARLPKVDKKTKGDP